MADENVSGVKKPVSGHKTTQGWEKESVLVKRISESPLS